MESDHLIAYYINRNTLGTPCRSNIVVVLQVNTSETDSCHIQNTIALLYVFACHPTFHNAISVALRDCCTLRVYTFVKHEPYSHDSDKYHRGSQNVLHRCLLWFGDFQNNPFKTRHDAIKIAWCVNVNIFSRYDVISGVPWAGAGITAGFHFSTICGL